MTKTYTLITKPNDFSLSSYLVKDLKLNLTLKERQFITSSLKSYSRSLRLPTPGKKYDASASNKYSTTFNTNLKESALLLLESYRLMVGDGRNRISPQTKAFLTKSVFDTCFPN